MPAQPHSDWADLSPQLDRLLTLPLLERSRRLEEIAANDAALSARLRALLEQRDAASLQGFLSGVAEPQWVAPPLVAGTVLGAWTLQEPIGEGGMGSVWRARRSDGRFEGEAAIKVLKGAAIDSAARERFRREGAILARLKHPGIARLFDAGITDQGLPYLVLELVHGEPIDRYCDAHRLATSARIELFLQVLDAVAAAHAQLVIHRDLKPSNILVDEHARMRLLDFGIAHLLPGSEGSQPALTREGAFALTPRYAAPEQASEAPLSTATDVYALGVVLYELLTGVHPSGLVGAAALAYLRAATEGTSVRPSVSALQACANGLDPLQRARARDTTPRALARRLRGDLDNILARALKPVAVERYATVPALADDLRRHLHHEPVSARPDAFAYRAAKFVRRHRWGSVAAAAFALAVVAGTTGTAWQAIEARRERDEARFQAERALGKGNFLNLVLGALGDADRPLTQREVLERSVALVNKQFGNDPRVAIDLLLPIAGQYMTLGDTQKELDVMQRAAVLAAASGDALLIADVACNTVETEIHRGRLDLAQSQLRLGLQAMARMARDELGVTMACLGAQADVAEAQGDLDRATELIADAVRRAEEGGRTRGNQYPTFLFRLSSLHELRGERTASFEILKRRQRLLEESGRADSLDYLGDLRDEAVLLMSWGEYWAARQIIDELGPRLRGARGGNEPPAWFEHTRGMLLWRFGDLQGADHALRASAERSRANGHVLHSLATEFAQAQVLLDLGQLDAAEAMLAKVEQALPVQTGGYRRLTPAGLRAQLLLARGAHADAARTIDAELTRIGQPGKDSNALAATLMLGARVHAATGDELPQATRLAQAAVGVAERIARVPQHSADVGEALLVLAQAQRRSGDVASSAATAQRAALSLANGLGPQHALTLEAQALAGH